MNKNTLRVFTAFSGYDSQCMALQRIGLDFDLVGWSEIDKNAIKAHNAVFPQYKNRNYGDICNIDWEKVPDFDLFTYSSPCQDFSYAGKMLGGERGSGTRSSLLWECEQAIEIKRPKYLIMENVSALVNVRFIKLFNKWQQVLEKLGYTNFSKVLNAKDFNVPQNRERIIMVSVLNCENAFYFPDKTPLKLRIKDILEKNVPNTYYFSQEKVRDYIKRCNEKQKHLCRYKGRAKFVDKEEKLFGYILTKHGYRETDTYIVEPTIVALRGREPNVLTTKRNEYGKYIRNEYEKGKLKEKRKNMQQFEPRTDGISNTITSVQKDNLLLQNSRVRRLTPLECFRLMGVLDKDAHKIAASIPKTACYKVAGNSIVVQVLENVFYQLFIGNKNKFQQMQLF